MTALFEVEGLSVSYGSIRAVRDVSLSLCEGEIVALIGPNGAGKSSTLNALVGLVPSSGTITAFGEQIDGLTPESIIRKGVTLSPEGRRVFASLSVEENLLLGGSGRFTTSHSRQNMERMYAMFPILAERKKQEAGSLSGGEQQQLAIARALMSEPRVLLLDEPSLGLAPQIVNFIFELVETMRSWRQTILIVEQNVEKTLKIADRAYVMVNGTIRMEGTASSFLADDSVREAYFGMD